MTDHPHAVVTGGAGFVGSHLVERLLADGYAVTTLDNYGSGSRDALAHLASTSRLTEIEHDIRAPLPSLDHVDEVYHLASRASPADFEQHAVEIAQTNSHGTQHVYEFAREHGASVVFASTSEVYGDPEVNPQPESYNGNVNIRGPRAPYDESKRFAEALGVAYRQAYGLDVRTVRIFNTYGPRMRIDDGRVVPNFIAQALRGDDLTVYGTGEQTRSFCYVTDLVDGVRRVAEAPVEQAADEVFNLGATDEITILALARLVKDVADSESEIIHHPRPRDDPEVRRPDISRVESTLGWTPETELKTGLGYTIDHFRQALGD
jgi:UDP-glucuronate decarboxylase